MTSVDPVEEAWTEYGEVQWVYYRDGLGESFSSDNAEQVAALNAWFAREEAARTAVTAAILTSDPRVQALEAVARAADGVRSSFECYIVTSDPKPEDQRDEYDTMVYPLWEELNRALAALQEVPGRGEDGDGN